MSSFATTSRDGTAIAYWNAGRGDPLLLVHGAIADHSTTWRFVSPILEAEFTVFAMDRRGRGGSGDTPPYDIVREAEDVAAVVESIGSSVHVLGHSFGALCALEASILTPNVASLVLYEGVPLQGTDGFGPGVIESLETLLAAGDTEALLVTMLRDVARMDEQDILMLRAQREAWDIRLSNAPTIPREMRAERGYVFDADRFGALDLPVLLLVGEESDPREMANAKGVARAFRRSAIRTLPGQQHVAMHTAPEEFAAVVTGFLRA